MNALVPMNSAPAMTVSDVERVANAIAKGGLFGSKDPNAVLTLCLLAQAEGQHPAVVFRDYHVINGKPAKKAEAMLRDFINAGGKVEWHQLDDTCADATFTHPAGNARIAWDHKRAQTAGLGGNQMYRKFPRQMLRSRVISEGIRTVYPGATSGLYEEGEVASFDAPREAYSGDSNEPANPQTGEVIEGEVVEREKVPGITKIKNNLNKFMRDGRKVTDLEAFRALVKANKDDIKTIREANHSYWTGDGEDFEGFEKWMERRYAELTPRHESTGFQLISSLVKECTTADALTSLLDEYAAVIEELDGEESRRFEEIYNARETALKSEPDDMTRAYTQEELRQAASGGKTPLEAGAFGG